MNEDCEQARELSQKSKFVFIMARQIGKSACRLCGCPNYMHTKDLVTT